MFVVWLNLHIFLPPFSPNCIYASCFTRTGLLWNPNILDVMYQLQNRNQFIYLTSMLLVN